MQLEYLEKKFSIDNHLINYIDEGEGFPILLIHGFPQSVILWRNTISRLKNNYRVIALDLRGMGNSSPCTFGQDKKTLAADAIQLLEFLKIDKCIVVGHDWGGAVAQRLVLEYPDFFSALINMGIPYMPDAKIEELTKPSQIFHNWYIFFHQLQNLPEIFIKKAGREYIRWMMEYGSHRKSLPIDEATLEVYSNTFCDEGKTPAYLNLYRTLFTQDAKDWRQYSDAVINIPTLWILASNDPFVPPQMPASILNKFININIKIIENCGHWIPEEQPEIFYALITEFLHCQKLN